MNGFDQALWDRLAAMEVSPPGASLTFTQRLAREENWKPAYASRVMEEYRRFLYLAATGRTAVTPSEAVDAAWHLHLTYTRHYWEELCPNILGKPLHHMPTEGGAAEASKHDRQYHETRAAYSAAFGSEPPTDIWPTPESVRPAAKPRRLAAIAAAAGGSFLLAACASMGSGKGSSFFDGPVFVIALIVIGFLAVITLLGMIFGSSHGSGRGGSGCGGGGCGSDSSDSSSSDSSSGDGGSSCGSSCGGGCGGGGGD